MSGGRFEYKQYVMTEIADKIEEYVDNPEDKDEYSEATLAEFRKGLKLLRQAHIYAQRIDWLLSSDDSEETFHERLAEDLSEIK